jgi:hypothetical protein
MNLIVIVNRRIVKNNKCPVIRMYEDSVVNDPILGKYNLALAVKQREEKIKEEYEAFIDMHIADGVSVSSSRNRDL